MFDCPLDFAHTLVLNCQVLLDRSTLFQVAFVVNITNVQADFVFAGLKDLDDLRLAQPGGFVFQTHVDSRLPAFGLVDEDL